MVTKPECPLMMENEKNYAIITGHQRANTTNSKLFNKPNCNSQQTSINDMQKSTYNAKVGNTEAMALFDSGTMLSCISKQFYDHIRQIELSMDINTSAGPPIVITSALTQELTNLGRCRLHIKLGPKTFEYYFQIMKNLK